MNLCSWGVTNTLDCVRRKAGLKPMDIRPVTTETKMVIPLVHNCCLLHLKNEFLLFAWWSLPEAWAVRIKRKQQASLRHNSIYLAGSWSSPVWSRSISRCYWFNWQGTSFSCKYSHTSWSVPSLRPNCAVERQEHISEDRNSPFRKSSLY
jgi:hypothetical protein